MADRWESRNSFPESLDLQHATYKELLELPLELVLKLDISQFFEFLCPSRVDYDEALILPPAINYLARSAQLARHISVATVKFGVPIHPRGYKQWILPWLDPWAVLSKYQFGSTAEMESFIGFPLNSKFDCTEHSPLCNACYLASISSPPRPLTNRAHCFVKAPLSIASKMV